MRLLILTIALASIYVCHSSQRVYKNSEQLVTQQNRGFIVYINDDKVDVKNVLMDLNSVSAFQTDYKQKEIFITLDSRISLITLDSLEINSIEPGRNLLLTRKFIELMIIDGLMLDRQLFSKFLIDPEIIETIEILPEEAMENMPGCKRFEGNIVLVSTKQ